MGRSLHRRWLGRKTFQKVSFLPNNHGAPKEEFSAFTQLYQASPYYQFAHFTANQAILEAFEKEEMQNCRRLHVVDFDVPYGFQWPSLIQSLSDRATSIKPISLWIMGFGRSIEELKETKTRLANFMKGCRNLIFKFEGLLRGSRSSDFKIEKDATLVVNLVFYLQKLRSSSDDTLMSIHSVDPSMVVLVEKEGSQNPQSFLSRFMESSYYYAAIFDSLNGRLVTCGDQLRVGTSCRKLLKFEFGPQVGALF